MTKPLLLLLSCLILSHQTTFTFASNIVFSSTPTSISPPFSTDLTLRCGLQDNVLPANNPVVGRRSVVDTNTNVHVVTSIEILKGTVTTGEKVASISTFFDAKSFGNWTDVDATGDLSANQPGEESYLELAWDEPTHAVGGNFTCVVHAFDETGSNVDFSTVLSIDIHVPTLPDLVNYITDLKNALTNPNSALTDRVNALESQNQALVASVSTLTAQNQGLNNTVNALTASVNTLTAENMGLVNSVNTLTSQNQGLVTSLNTLTSQNQGLNNTVNALSSSVDFLSSQNNGLTNSIRLLNSQTSTVYSQNQGLTTELTALVSEVGEVKQDMTTLESDIAETGHVEHGWFDCGGWSDTWHDIQNTTTVTKSFSKQYAAKPIIFLSFRQIAFYTPSSGDQMDVDVYLYKVTTTDFTVRCVDAEQRRVKLEINWLATPGVEN